MAAFYGWEILLGEMNVGDVILLFTNVIDS